MQPLSIYTAFANTNTSFVVIFILSFSGRVSQSFQWHGAIYHNYANEEQQTGAICYWQ